jgi:hypothetical protein
VPYSYDFHNVLLGLHSVHYPAGLANDFSDIGIAELRNNPPGLGKISQVLDRAQHILDEIGSGFWARLDDVYPSG